MPYNLLLLPLLGGFLFLHLTHYFRFAAQRLDGYRLLLYSAIAAIGLGIAARLIVVLSTPWIPDGRLVAWWHVFAPWPFAETGALALALGPVTAITVNYCLKAERAKDIEIRRHGDSLTKLLHRAECDDLLVSVTLTSMKWYVGYVAESPNLSPREEYFRLLPVISGYRNRETLQTVRTVFYGEVLRDPEVNAYDLAVTLPLQDIRIAGLFDEMVYGEYFAAATESPLAVRTARSAT